MSETQSAGDIELQTDIEKELFELPDLTNPIDADIAADRARAAAQAKQDAEEHEQRLQFFMKVTAELEEIENAGGMAPPAGQRDVAEWAELIVATAGGLSDDQWQQVIHAITAHNKRLAIVRPRTHDAIFRMSRPMRSARF